MVLDDKFFVSLSPDELNNIDGGEWIPWKKIIETAEKVATAIGIIDAADRFIAGFNSGNCK